MANLQKYAKSATGHMCAHFERRRDENGEYVKFHNQNIDTRRTHLNYNLAPEQNQIEFIQKRTSEVKCMKRADVNVMCSWCVTMPKDLPKEKEDDFFKATYNFLSEKYGKENVISAWVHKDEVTPHIHFAFVPVAFDEKKNIYKVSAKALIKKHDLKTFHTELNRYLENTLKCPVNVLNGATAGGNKTVEELKAEKEIREIKANKDDEINYYQEKAKSAEEEFYYFNKKKKSVKRDLTVVSEDLEKKSEELKSVSAEIDNKKYELEQLEYNLASRTYDMQQLEKNYDELQEEYEKIRKAPPKQKVVEVEKIVEVPKEVEVKKIVEVKKEVNIDFKAQAKTASDLVWRFAEWLSKNNLGKLLSETDPELDKDSTIFCRALRGIFRDRKL